jgi:pimeloyl-ACP methyl ester carboxylesterase
MTQFVTSADGTRIAYETIGSGPALVLVDGALCYRASGPARPLAEALKDRFTVYAYDRRGRGESSDTQPYAIDREIEDLQALVAAAGSDVFVYGISSGAALALETANRTPTIKRLFLYEAPFITDDTRRLPAGYVETMERLAKADDRSGMLVHFMRNGVGLPAFAVFMMRLMPFWKTMKRVAPTLTYDTALTGPFQYGKPLAPGRWLHLTQPAMVVGGTKSEPWMRNAQKAIAAALPNARHGELDGENHMVKPTAIAPLIKTFFA